MSHPSPDSQHDAERVRQFFDQWDLYRKVVDHNYLHHREAYDVITQTLQKIEKPFSFLDLGAGDASYTGQALARCNISRYEAVDLSEVALQLAEKNLQSLPGPKIFTQADFSRYVREIKTSFDVVYIGLSFHHLLTPDKQQFLAGIKRIVAPGGRLLFFEPFRLPDEDLDGVRERWWKLAQLQWNSLTASELLQAREHIWVHDYPETVESYRHLVQEAGFPDLQVLYTDPDRLYAVFDCRIT